MLSYAQNWEDVLLYRVFRENGAGFYVDIGAYDPVEGSVTKIFYDMGWHGINVEPSSVFDRLQEQRPRDINVQAAILDYDGVTKFIETSNDLGMSHVISETTVENETGPNEIETQVKCLTFATLLKTYAPDESIDFLKIDAEGSEDRIVRSYSWQHFRPKVIVIEATYPWSNELRNEKWVKFLEDHQYLHAYFDGLNLFFVAAEHKDLLKHFQIPVNCLDGFTKFDCGTTQMLGAIEGAKRKLENAKSKIQGTESEIAALRASYDAVARRAAQLDRLVEHLRFDEGPRCLRLVLPLARLACFSARRLRGGRHSNPAGQPNDLGTAQAIAAPAVPAGILGGLKSGLQTIFRSVVVAPVARLAFRVRRYLLAPLLEQEHQLRTAQGELQAALHRMAASVDAACLTLALERRATEQRSMESNPALGSSPVVSLSKSIPSASKQANQLEAANPSRPSESL